LINASGGVISGNGTIDVGAGNALTNRGTLRAGNSPGVLNIRGDLVLDGANGSITEIELAGLTPGTQYDVINVTGQIRGAGRDPQDWGTLNIAHIQPFAPAAGDTFAVMTYGSRAGDGDFTTRIVPTGFVYSATPNPTNYVVSGSPTAAKSTPRCRDIGCADSPGR
jgi:hypothetical protein